MLRVGVIGYGTMGQLHSEAIQEVPGAQLVAVAELDAECRAKAGRDFGVDVVNDVSELLTKTDVDLVDICVPTYLHESIMTEVMQANKHIFCEKPLARTLEEGKRLVDLASDYEPKIGIGHVVRFTPAYTEIRESVKQGEIGQAAVARTFRGGSQFPAGMHDWYADFDLSGGVTLDLAIHDIDFLRWLFGDVKRVYAKTTHGRTTAHLEWAMIVLRFENGVIAHIEGSWTNYPGEFYTTLEIAGKDGLVSYDSRNTQSISAITVRENQGHAGVAVPKSPTQQSPYFLELQDMVEAIAEDRSPLVSLQDAYTSLQVTLAAIESAQTGQVITL